MPSNGTFFRLFKNLDGPLDGHTHRVAVSADAHVTTVVACTFLEGSSSAERSTALSSDSRGRLVFQNVTGYLSITNFIAGLVPSHPHCYKESPRVSPEVCLHHLSGLACQEFAIWQGLAQQ